MVGVRRIFAFICRKHRIQRYVLSYKDFFLSLCVYIHSFVSACTYMCIYMHEKRPEVDVKCLP